jgi:RNA polymerase sigma factor (sigma-70 family)
LTFRPKNENELAQLEDDRLIAHAVESRDSGRQADFEAAIRAFVAKRIGLVSYWVGQKADGDEADEIAGKALVSIVEGAGKIKGSSTGEVVEWMRTVTARRIADHYRSKEKQPAIGRLDDQPKDEGERTEIAGEPDSTDAIDAKLVIDKALGDLDQIKREVVELRISGYSSKETSKMSRDSGMSPANVDQIFSRFRKALARELEV